MLTTEALEAAPPGGTAHRRLHPALGGMSGSAVVLTGGDAALARALKAASCAPLPTLKDIMQLLTTAVARDPSILMPLVLGQGQGSGSLFGHGLASSSRTRVPGADGGLVPPGIRPAPPPTRFPCDALRTTPETGGGSTAATLHHHRAAVGTTAD